MSRKLIGTVIKQSLSLSITVLNEHEKCSFMNRTHLRGFGAWGIVRNESPAPIIRCYQPLCITGIALHAWFDQRDIVLPLLCQTAASSSRRDQDSQQSRRDRYRTARGCRCPCFHLRTAC